METLRIYWSKRKKRFKSWSVELFKFLCLFIVRLYRAFLSGHLGGCCRYYPTCSLYALEALEKRPFPQFFFLIIKRLFRCHPFTKRIGYDPLPLKKDEFQQKRFEDKKKSCLLRENRYRGSK